MYVDYLVLPSLYFTGCCWLLRGVKKARWGMGAALYLKVLCGGGKVKRTPAWLIYRRRGGVLAIVQLSLIEF